MRCINFCLVLFCFVSINVVSQLLTPNYCCLDYCFRTHSGYFDKRSLALDTQTTSDYSDIDLIDIRYLHWSCTHTHERIEISR